MYDLQGNQGVFEIRPRPQNMLPFLQGKVSSIVNVGNVHATYKCVSIRCKGVIYYYMYMYLRNH